MRLRNTSAIAVRMSAKPSTVVINPLAPPPERWLKYARTASVNAVAGTLPSASRRVMVQSTVSLSP